MEGAQRARGGDVSGGHEKHSELDEACTELEEALQSAWNALPDLLFEGLVESMPRRIQALLEAKGWHTKY